MAGEERTLAGMRRNLIASLRAGLFPELTGVFLAWVKLELLKRRGAEREFFRSLAQQMWAEVRAEADRFTDP